MRILLKVIVIIAATGLIFFEKWHPNTIAGPMFLLGCMYAREDEKLLREGTNGK